MTIFLTITQIYAKSPTQQNLPALFCPSPPLSKLPYTPLSTPRLDSPTIMPSPTHFHPSNSTPHPTILPSSHSATSPPLLQPPYTQPLRSRSLSHPGHRPSRISLTLNDLTFRPPVLRPNIPHHLRPSSIPPGSHFTPLDSLFLHTPCHIRFPPPSRSATSPPLLQPPYTQLFSSPFFNRLTLSHFHPHSSTASHSDTSLPVFVPSGTQTITHLAYTQRPNVLPELATGGISRPDAGGNPPSSSNLQTNHVVCLPASS